jgi:membrane-bound lytic murein transglycosylase D
MPAKQRAYSCGKDGVRKGLINRGLTAKFSACYPAVSTQNLVRMPSKQLRHSFFSVAAGFLIAGCASGSGAKVAEVTPTRDTAPHASQAVAQPAADPVTTVVATSNSHFEAGQQALSQGHLEQARREFDLALDVVLQFPGGAHTDSRLRQHFELLVDRISVLEQTALATGDGFTETHTEPASIDLLFTDSFDTTPPTLETTLNVEADLQATTHDIPIPANDQVLRYVQLFQGRLREFLAEGLSRGAQYLPMIQNVFRAEGLPLDLAYVPLIESAFKPSALSRAKARGVWQFMRATGIENGLKADWYVDERADPEKATVAAAKYLKTLYRMFDDWHLAMASYNGGPGRVQRAMKRSRKDDFWDLTATTRYLPRETRDYVPMILAAIIIAKNPAQYGFEITPLPPTPTETVTLPAGLDLRRVAEWAETPIDDIQQLNPELRRWTTPIREEAYELTVPAGTAVRIAEKLQAAEPSQLNALQWHTVKKGESLAVIARKLRVSRTDLAEANYLKTTARVRVGQRLVIPRMPSAALLARAGSTGGKPEAMVASAATEAGAENTPARIYRVRPGDTLYKIARRHNTTVTRLRSLNNLTTNTLAVGKRLVVEPARPANAQQ